MMCNVFHSSLSEFLAEQGNTFHDAFLTDQVMPMVKVTGLVKDSYGDTDGKLSIDNVGDSIIDAVGYADSEADR